MTLLHHISLLFLLILVSFLGVVRFLNVISQLEVEEKGGHIINNELDAHHDQQKRSEGEDNIMALPLCQPLNLTAAQDNIICIPRCTFPPPKQKEDEQLRGRSSSDERIKMTVTLNQMGETHTGDYGKYRVHFPEEDVYLLVDGHEYTKSPHHAMHPRSITERLFRRVIVKLFQEGVLDPTKNIINTGSWIGDNALPWAMMLKQMTNHPGKVYAMDPSPTFVNNMVNTAYLNSIGNICTHVTVYSAKEGSVFTGSTEHMTVNLRANEGKRVNMITLDSENIEDVTLLHLDVEGHESELLEGARELIKSSRPVIVTEGMKGLTDANDEKVAAILKSLDYVNSTEIPEIVGWNENARNHIWWPDQTIMDAAMKVIGPDLSRSDIVPWVASELTEEEEFDNPHQSLQTTSLLRKQQQPQNTAEFNLTYSIEQYKNPPKLLHVLWGRPLQDIDKTFDSKERTFSENSFTGCCDQLLELALKSYMKHLPSGYQIYFWNIGGGWDLNGFLRHIGLSNKGEESKEEHHDVNASSSSSSSCLIKPMDFDPKIEMSHEPELISIYEQLHAVVPRSDFVRYYVMEKYGGSYVDLDGILVRSIHTRDGVPKMNLSPTEQSTLDLQTCAGSGYFRQPGACIISNGLFVEFPPNHVVFRTIVDTIKNEKRTCGGEFYFCYGPQWMTRTLLNAGIRNLADLGIEVGPFLRNGGEYRWSEEVFVAHMGLGMGDSNLVADALCNASSLHSELCQEYNVTGLSREPSSNLDNERASWSVVVKDPAVLSNITDELFTNPSLFESKTQIVSQCDTSQQKSWEMAVASRYDALDDKCISPDENLLDHYGPSGPGSSLRATSSLRSMLTSFIHSRHIKTFLDAPCGDWLWMQTMNLTGLQYFGGDITNVTVQTNQRCFGSDNVHFHWFDLTCMVPPAVDLILVRDVLFHLPEDHVHKILNNINLSGAKYLATTTFVEGENGSFQNGLAYQETIQERAIKGLKSPIGFQRLNLYGPPFNFPLPLMKAEESVPGRQVGIWELPLPLVVRH